MSPKIWMSGPLSDDLMRQMNAVAELVTTGNTDDMAGVDVILIGNQPDADADLMDAAGPQLKAIIRFGIGVDNIDIPAASERGILVAHTPDAPTESTAEHTVALLLGVAKRIVSGNDILRGADLPRSAMQGTEVQPRTLGIVGLGRIGRRVGEICALGLRMKTIGYDPYVTAEEVALLGIETVDDLDSLIKQSDFLTLHVPHVPQTHHLMDERRLRLLKAGSYLINASRGPVVDEIALIRVLQDGHLAGAALDVFDPEPPDPDNPLLHMSNVVVTPHIASYTDRGMEGMRTGVAMQAIQVLRGERPTYLINKEVWPGRVSVIMSRHTPPA